MSEHSPIRLGQFLKFAGLAQTGGQARDLVQSGAVSVDGHLETRRGRQLAKGMRVCVHRPDGSTDQAVVGADGGELSW